MFQYKFVNPVTFDSFSVFAWIYAQGNSAHLVILALTNEFDFTSGWSFYAGYWQRALVLRPYNGNSGYWLYANPISNVFPEKEWVYVGITYSNSPTSTKIISYPNVCINFANNPILFRNHQLLCEWHLHIQSNGNISRDGQHQLSIAASLYWQAR